MDFPSPLLVISIISLVYLASQVYLFSRVRDYLERRWPDQKLRWPFLGFVSGFFLLMLVPFVWRFLYGWQSHPPVPWLFQGLAFVFAIWSVGSLGTALILSSSGLLQRVVSGLRAPMTAPDLERRNFLKKSVGVAATAPFLVSGYGALLGRHRFRIEEFDLPIAGLSSDLSQFSIVQLTDIHVGPFMPAEELARYVEAVNRLGPDLIVLTGDFVSSTVDEVAPCVDTLAGLKARYGIFACMGNHDLYARAGGELSQRFADMGARMLRNEAASVRLKGTALNILGIEDLRSGRPNLRRALKTADSDPGEVRVLLSHRPEAFPTAARNGIDIVLSGHYHGGQIKLAPEPDALSIASLMTPYAEGLFHLPSDSNSSAAKGSLLFVGRGIGITGLPIRINCPPQIAHLILKKA